MFIKTTKSKNYTYLQVVQSYREGKATRHKVIANLGRLDLLFNAGSLKAMGEKLLLLNKTPNIDPSKIEESARLCYGHLVYKKIWDKLGLGAIIEKCAKNTNIKFDLPKVIFYCVIHRLLKSKSKLQAFKDQDLFYNLDKIDDLQEIYRSLDFLSDNKQALETQLLHSKKGVFAKSIQVAFYDVTNYHFESNRADDLREFGFSKAGKFNEVQVVMGLFVDINGRPIGYELFPGNTFDGQTMVKALDILKRRFKIKKVIVVADKGLNSKQNFHLIRDAGYEYIVSARLKSLPHTLRKQVLSNEDLEVQNVDEDTGEIRFGWKSLDLAVEYTDEQKQKQKWTDKLLVTWSSKRAAKDARDRNRQIEKAQKKLSQGVNLQNKKGPHRYLKITTNSNTKAIDIDQERIDEDAKWDGFYGIQYSKKDMTKQEVLSNYKQLWKIEESFRVLKTTLKTRPIYHRTAKRIKGHFMTCFLAFMLERELELILKTKKINLSPCKIKSELNQMQLSAINIENQKFFLKGKDGEFTNQILDALKIAKFKNCVAAE